MVNLTQVVLVAVITTLTILLTFIGFQVIGILREVKETLRRINQVVDHAETIAAAAVKPVTGLSALVEGVQSSIKIAEILGLVKRGARHAVEELPERAREAKERVEEELGEIKEDVGGVKQDLERRDEGVAGGRAPGNGERRSRESRVRRFFHRGGSPLG